MAVVQISRMIVFILLVFHNLLRRHTEDESVLFANFFHDLHIGAIHSSDSHRAVQHELHVSCS